jgi:uncharacterized protein YciI
MRGFATGMALLLTFAGAEARAEEPSRMTAVYLVLLKKGPSWAPGESPALRALQEKHLANIRALWQAKKLVIAGPVEDEAGDLRGLFVFQAESLDQAKEWAGSDPAVKAGRLTPVVYPWWVEKGVLPEAGAYCTPPPGR